MRWIEPELELVDGARDGRPTWTKPEFEFVDLCCEVTLYLYHE
ncbi:MAG TPA: pyrroloquinoline quinone precursor peptide PqqA [Thermoleophilaceae bacterium]|nr:pyrroloquinoline quinone precursor peptide PqqA [Thermoleophilaceae bacterium]